MDLPRAVSNIESHGPKAQEITILRDCYACTNLREIDIDYLPSSVNIDFSPDSNHHVESRKLLISVKYFER